MQKEKERKGDGRPIINTKFLSKKRLITKRLFSYSSTSTMSESDFLFVPVDFWGWISSAKGDSLRGVLFLLARK